MKLKKISAPSWWGEGSLPLPKNLTPALGLRSRFSAIRASARPTNSNFWLRSCNC